MLGKYFQLLVAPDFQKDDVDFYLNNLIEGKLVYAKIAEEGRLPKVVEKGQVLFKEFFIKENEKNELSKLDNFIDFQVKKYAIDGLGKYIRKDINENYIAETEGVYFIYKNIPQIIPIKYDGVFVVHLSDDEMSINIDIYPPGPGGSKVLFKHIFSRLTEMMVKVEIKTAAIERTLERLETSKMPLYGLNACQGIPVLQGKDGIVEFYFSTNKHGSAQIGEDGKLDFHNLNLINTIDKDQELAKYFPHVKGHDGKDVFGKVIQCIEGKACKFIAGKNTYFSPNDENLLLAKTTGSVKYSRNIIEINEVLKIDGNIDFHVGNIESLGAVKVTGDVKSGFKMKVRDDIEIGGVVEDANIDCNQNVLVKSGFIGTGKGIILADGDISLRYIRNQSVYSRKSLFVLNEIIDSKIHAKENINVSSGALLGGYAIAGELFEANTIGNEYGVNTQIEVGYDYKIFEDVLQIDDDVKNLKAIIDKVDVGISSTIKGLNLKPIYRQAVESFIADRKKRILVKDPTQKISLVNRGIEQLLQKTTMNETQINSFLTLIDQQMNLYEEIDNKQKLRIELQKQVTEPSKGKIIVNRRIYPGVMISINRVKFTVDRILMNKTFVLAKESRQIVII